MAVAPGAAESKPMTKSLLVILLMLPCVGAISADRALRESPANNQKILALIAQAYERPLDPATAGKLSVIMKYAEAAEKILVSVKADSLDMKDPHASLYMGFFVAGATRFDLEHPRQAMDRDGADREETNRFLKRLYDQLKERDPTYTSDFYGTLK